MKQNIGIIVFNKAILPKVGEEFEVNHKPDANDAKKLTIAIQGIDFCAITKDTLVEQLSAQVVPGNQFFDEVGDFKNNVVTGVVVGVEDVVNSNGGTNSIVILETTVTPKNAAQPQKAAKSNEVVLEFKGSVQVFPDKKDFIDLVKNNKPLTEEMTVAKKDNKVILYYGDKAIGEGINVPADVAARFKNFDNGNKFPCEYKLYEVGNIKVNVKMDDLKVDISDAFDAEKTHALNVGVSEEEFDQYINLMVDVYGLPVKLVKMVIQTWKPLNDKYAERYIGLDRICVKDKKGNIHPLYIDQFDYVKRCAAYLVSGKENVNLKGEASVGKNILIETLAGLFRKPLLRESLSGGTDLGALLGDRTVNNDNSIGFEPSQLIKAAEDGCWVVLDEINTVQTEYLTVLHSLLESNVRAINVPFYKHITADNDFRVLATMNPVDTGEYVGTKELNSATASRFKTIEIQSNIAFENVLKNACPEAKGDEVKSVARVYGAIKKIYDSRQSELSPGFLAIRRYTSILNDEVANEFITLKERCIDSLKEANPNDRVQSEIVLQTINDCIQ